MKRSYPMRGTQIFVVHAKSKMVDEKIRQIKTIGEGKVLESEIKKDFEER